MRIDDVVNTLSIELIASAADLERGVVSFNHPRNGRVSVERQPALAWCQL